MILAGDIGGTKTLVGLFEPRAGRPVHVHTESFPTTAFPGLPEILEAFFDSGVRRHSITVAAFGVAGPVINQRAEMTNVAWYVDADELRRRFAFPHVRLLNDLEATAYSVPVLEGDELTSLQAGHAGADGNISIVAAGTGLGGALLHRLHGRYTPVASELGHSDFAGRTDRELELVRYIRTRHGRCSIEHVVCGPGLVNVAEFTHQDTTCQAFSHAEVAAEVSDRALAGACACCVEALELFVTAYGAVAGNLALIGVSTGGVYIGGGIAPRILPALQDGRFMAAFRDKPPMRPLLETMPVHVILNPDAGLVGAAMCANQV